MFKCPNTIRVKKLKRHLNSIDSMQLNPYYRNLKRHLLNIYTIDSAVIISLFLYFALSSNYSKQWTAPLAPNKWFISMKNLKALHSSFGIGGRA